MRWIPSPSQGVQGYVLSLGTTSGTYDSSRAVNIPLASATAGSGGTLTYTIQLDRARDQYLAMRAFDANNFSVFSNEIRVGSMVVSSATTTSGSGASTGTTDALLASEPGSGTSRASAGSGSTASALEPEAESAGDSETEATSAFASLDLNGEDEYLATALSDPLDLSGGLSASLWGKVPQDGAGRRGLLQLACADSGSACALELSLVQGEGGAALELRVFDAASGVDDVREVLVALTPGEWWHLGLVLDPAGSARLYFDGELVANEADVRLPAGLASAAHALSLGATEAGRAAPWLGRLGHAAVFASALDGGEVAEISLHGHELDLRADLGAYRSSSALVHYWRLGDDTDAVGADSGPGALDFDAAYGNVDGADVVSDGPESLASDASVASAAQ